MLKAVLFDMDGVIMDSLDAWWVTFNGIRKLYGSEPVSREKFMGEILGEPIQDDINTYFPGLGVEELRRLYFKHFKQNSADVVTYPGVPELLETLQGKCIKTAVVTNTERPTALEILEGAGIKKYLNCVVSSDDVENGKPAPDMLLKALRLLDVEPGNALMVGDTVSDVNAGRAAGVRVVGVRCDADYRIEDIRELVPLISELGEY